MSVSINLIFRLVVTIEVNVQCPWVLYIQCCIVHNMIDDKNCLLFATFAINKGVNNTIMIGGMYRIASILCS